MKSVIEYQMLGVLRYAEALALQEKLRESRIAGRICDRLLLLEHYPVFTLGKQDCHADLLTPASKIEQEGIEVVKTTRGGRVTYHGPGQLVAYFIFDMGALGLGVRDFVAKIEDVAIDTLGEFGVKGERDPAHPGIWVGSDKVAAIGLNISRGVSEHGIAVNVDMDLSPYRHIVACGIRQRGVVTMSQILRKSVGVGAVARALARSVGRTFNSDVVELPASA